MTDNTSHTPDGLPRRAVLLGLVGAGGFAVLPGDAAASETAVGTPVTESSEAATADPHTEATFRAVAAAMIPRTPELAAEETEGNEELGQEHVPGALAVDVEKFLIYAFNSYFPTTPTTPDQNARGAESVAAVLDEAATELLARGENEAPPDPARFPAGGSFASLAPKDRFRAIDIVERRDLTLDSPTGESDTLDLLTDYPGVQDFAMIGLNSFTVVGYYTEWAGYGETKTDDPTEREFTGDVQSWAQTDYPGPARGHAELRGFEVREFEEGEY